VYVIAYFLLITYLKVQTQHNGAFKTSLKHSIWLLRPSKTKVYLHRFT